MQKVNRLIIFLFLCFQVINCNPLRKDIPFLPRQAEFAKNVSKLIHYINVAGYDVTFGETFRTKEQAEIYAAKGIGIRDSNHCYRLAVDLNLFKDGKYLTKEKYYRFAGAYWQTLNKHNDWFSSDSCHFEAD